MSTFIQLYNDIRQTVSFFFNQLKLDKFKNKLGRKLALKLEDIISLALYKHKNAIPTKKSIYQTFEPPCSYKTLVVNLNRWRFLALIILVLVIKMNRANAHPVKHIDSTTIPVCLFKNANAHKTMKGIAKFGRGAKGTFYGLKLHIITDLRRKLLSIKFTGGNVNDQKAVIPLSQGLVGIFVADAGYASDKLAREFYQENKRLLLFQPRKNMKRLITKFQNFLYGTRMLIELNFRSLKMFYGLVTSLPRSVAGYLANYIYSLLAYQLI